MLNSKWDDKYEITKTDSHDIVIHKLDEKMKDVPFPVMRISSPTKSQIRYCSM